MKMTSNLNIKEFTAELQALAVKFNSGNTYLDSFLRNEIALDNNYGKTYVMLSDDDSKIIGYYNLGVGYIEQCESGLRRKIGGAVHINCFALAVEYHGLRQSGIGSGISYNLSDVLLGECLHRVELIREEDVGFSFVSLSSTKEGHSLYLRNGFEDLEEDMNFSVEDSDIECKQMYLIMDCA